MSDATPAPRCLHLVISGAGHPAEPPVLPMLTQLLRRLALTDEIAVDDDGPAQPVELLLARLHGLPDEPGRTPWAAFESGLAGVACAWVQPCHWQVGADQVVLDDPALLKLDETGSRALMAAAAPYFLEDGISLSWHSPGAWLARGDVFRALTTCSPARMQGRRITPLALQGAGGGAGAANALRRLQSEIQMLFYTHPVNDARLQQGLLPVNSFWISGAGMLAAPVQPAPEVVLETRLDRSELRHDPHAHARAWQEVDSDACAHLVQRLQAGEDVRLSLCGDRLARTYRPAPASLLGTIKRLLGLQPPSTGLDTL